MSAAAPAQAKPTCSPLEARHAPYFLQRTVVGRELMGRSRLNVFSQLCAERRVLHVGCVDWPITDVRNSLHLQLERHCAALDGFDVHAECFDALRPHLRGRLFSDWKSVADRYDIVLVPEVLEHVPDVAGFLRQLDQVDASHFILTVPDAYSCFHRHFDYDANVDTFVEAVHPDHNCWYTPYTFANVIRKYTNWNVDGLWFFNSMSLLMIASRPKLPS